MKENLAIKKKFRPGDIVQLEGSYTSGSYMILITQYKLFEYSKVYVLNMQDNNKHWYSPCWFQIYEPGNLTELEKLIYNVNDLKDY